MPYPAATEGFSVRAWCSVTSELHAEFIYSMRRFIQIATGTPPFEIRPFNVPRSSERLHCKCGTIWTNSKRISVNVILATVTRAMKMVHAIVNCTWLFCVCVCEREFVLYVTGMNAVVANMNDTTLHYIISLVLTYTFILFAFLWLITYYYLNIETW